GGRIAHRKSGLLTGGEEGEIRGAEAGVGAVLAGDIGRVGLLGLVRRVGLLGLVGCIGLLGLRNLEVAVDGAALGDAAAGDDDLRLTGANGGNHAVFIDGDHALVAALEGDLIGAV